ncbi:hypothetical protein NP590_15365 [Methylomonas sp. SURF-2]|uniref:Uncharacterized protein n=1 Tax=Methylomonas subterranea TaxID=2952225 RepID=A0ABT1TJ43_9GAMM|nr:hypothetical protein [Methylomonas sp. SURF-2]MCQ8105492.1 hypothetical protein [Methylomonas sp. SURF-2]
MLNISSKTVESNHAIWGLIFYGVMLITGFIYFQSLNAGVQFDDVANLQDLGKIYDYDSAKNFVLSGIAGPLGRPLALLTFALQYYAWPANPEVMIEWNIYLHLLNGALVTMLAFNLGRGLPDQKMPLPRIAVFAGALWLVLPILVSSSLFIVQRMTTLSATFTFSGLIFYTKVRLQALNQPERHLIKLSSIVIVFSALAAFSKENGILFPVYALVIESTFFSANCYHTSHNAWRIWQWTFLLFPLLIIVGYLILQVPYHDSTILQRGFTETERIAIQGYILWLYLFRAFFPIPSKLGPFHDEPWLLGSYEIFFGLALFACLVIIGYFCIRYRKRFPLLAFAILWYLFGHMLESTTIALELYFEHRNYVPLFGPVFALIVYLSSIPKWRNGLTLFSTSYIVLLGLITYMTTHLWGRPLIAAEIWAMDNPKSNRATLHLAKRLEIDGDTNTALQVLDRFNKRYPDSLGLQIPALKLSCVLNPTGDHAARLNELISNAPTARFENWAVDQPEQFHAWLMKHHCAGMSFRTVSFIVDAMISNHRFASSPIAMHNLFVLKGIIALQYEDIAHALQHFDTALTYHIGNDALKVALLVAQTQNKTEFIDKWSSKAK